MAAHTPHSVLQLRLEPYCLPATVLVTGHVTHTRARTHAGSSWSSKEDKYWCHTITVVRKNIQESYENAGWGHILTIVMSQRTWSLWTSDRVKDVMSAEEHGGREHSRRKGVNEMRWARLVVHIFLGAPEKLPQVLWGQRCSHKDTDVLALFTWLIGICTDAIMKVLMGKDSVPQS